MAKKKSNEYIEQVSESARELNEWCRQLQEEFNKYTTVAEQKKNLENEIKIISSNHYNTDLNYESRQDLYRTQPELYGNPQNHIFKGTNTKINDTMLKAKRKQLSLIENLLAEIEKNKEMIIRKCQSCLDKCEALSSELKLNKDVEDCVQVYLNSQGFRKEHFSDVAARQKAAAFFLTLVETLEKAIDSAKKVLANVQKDKTSRNEMRKVSPVNNISYKSGNMFNYNLNVNMAVPEAFKKLDFSFDNVSKSKQFLPLLENRKNAKKNN